MQAAQPQLGQRLRALTMATEHVEGAAIALVVALVVTCMGALLSMLLQRHRSRSRDTIEPAGLRSAAKVAWGDVEQGKIGAPEKVALLDLSETFLGALEAEITKHLQRSRTNERLDRLEKEVLVPRLSCELGAAAPVTGHVVDLSSTAPPLPPSQPPPGVQPRRETRDAEVATEPQDCGRRPRPPDLLPPFTFGPSARQQDLVDPPEKPPTPISEKGEASEARSVKALQRQLAKRDAQKSELLRQLRALEQVHWKQHAEARHTEKRLQALLSDPSLAPAVQAEELNRLQALIEEVAGKLADSKAKEVFWELAAKRHRAFFMQMERANQEGTGLIRRHPAGEIFLAPPPTCLDGDDEDLQDLSKPPWDVGTSHVNPYVTDSWPCEPNVLAARCAVEPDLPSWDEEAMNESSSDDGGRQDSETGFETEPAIPDCDDEDDLLVAAGSAIADIQDRDEAWMHPRSSGLANEGGGQPPEPPIVPSTQPFAPVSARSL